MASTARPPIRTIRSRRPAPKPSREEALRKIAGILEDQMTDMGFSEEEKNAKTAELVDFVSDTVTSKLAHRAKPSRRLRSVGVRA